MIHARFDQIVNLANREEDRTGFVRCLLAQVPDVGETINLQGNPFIILERRWAIDEENGEQWVYVRCLPAFREA